MLTQRTEYSRYYGGFRGVDFATDHTLVADNRFPYAVNMYKDYVSGAGQGIETIPGFRRRLEVPNGKQIFGIHPFKDTSGAQKVLIHAGNVLYDWSTYGSEAEDVSEQQSSALFEAMNERDSVSFIFNNRLYLIDGKNYLVYDGNVVSAVKDEAYIPTTYINIIPAGENADIGTEYEQRNMLSPYFKHTFIADGTNNVFRMNEQKLQAIESVKVYGTELATKDYEVDLGKGEITLGEAPGKPEDNGCPEFYAGVEITAKKTVYEAKDVKIKNADGTYTTLSAYRGDDPSEFVSMIESATIAAIFDNRVFLSGIPGKPNLILYCGRNSTGFSDPSYIGILNYMEDGVGTTPITAMLGVADTLLVLKNDTQQDGSVYYHSKLETNIDILPKVYPSEAGLAGTGCLGAAVNFLDDPVFISRLGLDAIGQLSVRYERAREHRSSLVDSKLVNVPDLSSAKLCEWGGYLIVLCDGKIFMADSRQVYQNASGNLEYEWYYLEDIGVFEGQDEKKYFLEYYPGFFTNEDGTRREIKITYAEKEIVCKIITDIAEDDRPQIENALLIESGFEETENASTENTKIEYMYAVFEINGEYVAFLCNGDGEQIGGDFCKACNVRTVSYEKGENLFFGTTNGVVCSFNFDKKDAEGLLDRNYYTFDGRAIFSGCALKMDNCGTPNMVKSTRKRTTVVKTKNFFSSGAKIRVRTNKNPYKEISRINSKRFAFDDMDFSDFTFAVDGTTLFSIVEKEKRWVEKQYFIYSDEFKKPFSMFYLAYKYIVMGKYKG